MTLALIASVCVALLSLIGVFFIGEKSTHQSLHRYIIPIAVGVFLGVIFIELIPETLHGSEFYGALAIAGGFFSFYLLSHYLRGYHHHHTDNDQCEHKTGARMLLVGDAVHNVSDGVVIAGAFLVNPAVGIAATIGIALHELAQEIAEYGVLIHAGYTRTQALFYNFLSASSIFVGVALAAFFVQLGDYLWILTGIAAGNLLYIVASDMIPELSGEEHKEHFMHTFVSTLLGFLVIVALITYAHGEHTHEEHHEHEDHH